MERDPQSTNWSTPAALHDADRPSAAGAGHGRHARPYAAIAAVVAIVLLSALVFSTLAVRLHPGPSHGTTGSGTYDCTHGHADAVARAAAGRHLAREHCDGLRRRRLGHCGA
jgi:hypothetical protein